MKYQIKVGIIGGTGLDDPTIMENAKIRKVDTPFGPPSDNLLEGTIGNVPCVLLSRHGRNHNITPSQVNYRANIWALKEAGCTHVLVSNACGSLQEDIEPGDVVIPDSFIDRTFKREVTFYNNNEPFPEKVVHIPMEPAFCNETRKLLVQAAKNLGVKYHDKGTVVVIEGPRFSSLAESKVYRWLGAHLINMTVCPEVCLAKELGLCYASVAMATDYDCWNEKAQKVNVVNVEKVFRENIEKVTKIFIATIDMIKTKNWDSVIEELKKTVESSVQSK